LLNGRHFRPLSMLGVLIRQPLRAGLYRRHPMERCDLGCYSVAQCGSFVAPRPTSTTPPLPGQAGSGAGSGARDRQLSCTRFSEAEVPAVQDNADQRGNLWWSTRWGQTARLLRAPSSPEKNSGASNS
jgi:hypothetical protein